MRVLLVSLLMACLSVGCAAPATRHSAAGEITVERRMASLKRWQAREPAPLAGERNAMAVWRELPGLVGQDDELETRVWEASREGPPLSEDEHRRVAAWIEKNQPAHDALRRSVERGAARWIEWNKQGPILAGLRRVSRSMRTEARWGAQRNKLDRAQQNVVLLLRAAELTRRSGGMLAWMVGDSLEAAAVESMEAFAADARTPVETLRLCIASLEATKPVHVGFDEALGAEMANDLILKADSANGGRYLDGLEELVSLLIEAAPMPPYQREDKRLTAWIEQIERENRKRFDASFEHMKRTPPDSQPAAQDAHIRQFWNELLTPDEQQVYSACEYVLRTTDRSEVRRRLVVTVLALRVFERERDRLPGSLDELVDAKLVSSVPRDWFADRPLGYDLERRIVWSVGSDGEDDSGEGRLNETIDRDTDWAWVMPGDKE